MLLIILVTVLMMHRLQAAALICTALFFVGIMIVAAVDANVENPIEFRRLPEFCIRFRNSGFLNIYLRLDPSGQPKGESQHAGGPQ